MKIPTELRWQATGKTLGKGGQAQVQQVTDKNSEYPGTYAFKALANGKSPQAYDRFYREIAAIKRLDHPNIIKVVDSSTAQDEFHYYVMELIEGAKTLQSVLNSKDNPFLCNPAKSVDLFIQIAKAISACEGNEPKCVHRDLSPANVLLAPDGTIRIIDFGVCQVEGEETITLIDEGVGTANYMAPECESGAQGDIGTHSDLYSAGKIMWSAVTGQRAFSREKPAFRAKSMSNVFPDNPDTWHLYHIFAKTIRHDPVNRWQKAQDAIDGANNVKRLILCGFPTIEEVFDKCPICGFGSLEQFSGGHVVFGNPNPNGIYAKQCTYCGVCFAINYKKKNDHSKMIDAME